MYWYNMFYKDLDNNTRKHWFNATCHKSADAYCKRWCEKYGFKYLGFRPTQG